MVVVGIVAHCWYILGIRSITLFLKLMRRRCSMTTLNLLQSPVLSLLRRSTAPSKTLVQRPLRPNKFFSVSYSIVTCHFYHLSRLFISTSLQNLARTNPPVQMDHRHADIVESCRPCLDKTSPDLGDEKDFLHEVGILVRLNLALKISDGLVEWSKVSVRYIGKVSHIKRSLGH